MAENEICFRDTTLDTISNFPSTYSRLDTSEIKQMFPEQEGWTPIECFTESSAEAYLNDLVSGKRGQGMNPELKKKLVNLHSNGDSKAKRLLMKEVRELSKSIQETKIKEAKDSGEGIGVSIVGGGLITGIGTLVASFLGYISLGPVGVPAFATSAAYAFSEAWGISDSIAAAGIHLENYLVGESDYLLGKRLYSSGAPEYPSSSSQASGNYIHIPRSTFTDTNVAKGKMPHIPIE